MLLPDEIIIGPYTYRVRELTEEEYECDDEGGISHVNLVIRLHLRNRNPQFVLDTLLHEVSHGVNHVAGVDDDTKEEDQVTRTTPVWMQVYRDNPTFWNMLDAYRLGRLDKIEKIE